MIIICRLLLSSNKKNILIYYSLLLPLITITEGSLNSTYGNTSRFWYNANGQLVLSQDATQAQRIPVRYSYTQYDALGRIVEVGELSGFTPTFLDQGVNQQIEQLWTNPGFPDNVVGIQTYEQVSTVYSRRASGLTYNGRPQQHLRNRVSYSFTEDGYTCYYSYDPHGNVEWLIQELPELGRKSMRYVYDLVSGNVLKVYYQEGSPEQFIHRYSYDEDNRITAVYTSLDDITWEKEAAYTYYAHGPLSRSEIGQDKLQGLDYTYTIEEYLKTINHPALDVALDPSKDGAATDFVQDEFGMELGYYEGDYTRSNTFIGQENPANPYLHGGLTASVNSLYNGNISHWMSNTRSGQAPSTDYDHRGLKMRAFRYDKLNRLKVADFQEWNNSGNKWDMDRNVGSGNNQPYYDEYFTYDPDGNILTALRYGNDHVVQGKRNSNNASKLTDQFTYHYPNPNNNQLTHVDDALGNSFGADIGDQDPNNYVYDDEGNLIEDRAEKLRIEWNLINKVAKVRKYADAGLTVLDQIVEFEYDATGNRVMKRVRDGNSNQVLDATYYVRDASGNPMAIYTKQFKQGQTTFRIKEYPIYGSSRIGQYRPEEKLAVLDGAISEQDGYIQPSNASVQAQWLLPTNAGTDLFSQQLSNTYQVAANVGTVASSQTAIQLEDQDQFLTGAFSSGNQWYLFKRNQQLMTSHGFSLSASSGLNAAAIFVPVPGQNDWYYFIYTPDNTGFGELRYVIVDMTADNGNGEIVSSQEEVLAPGFAWGRNVEVINYPDGNSRLFAYSADLNTHRYLLYSIDITETGIAAPQQRAELIVDAASSLTPGNEMALAPDGSYLAMSMTAPVLTPDGLYDIAVWDLESACGELGEVELFYNDHNTNGFTFTEHVECSPNGAYLYLTTSPYTSTHATYPATLRRLDLSDGTQATLTSFTGASSVDLARGLNNQLFLQEAGSPVLQEMSNPDEAAIANMIFSTAATFTHGLAGAFPVQAVQVNEAMQELQPQRLSEFEHWIVGTKSKTTTSGAVALEFLDDGTVARTNYNISASTDQYDVMHNVAMAEDKDGDVVFKFFVVDGEKSNPFPVSFQEVVLVNQNDQALAMPNGATILTDFRNKSIAAKLPGDNLQYVLITGQGGNLYYHIIDMSVGANGSVLAPVNRILQYQFSSPAGPLVSPLTYNDQYALAVYNDLRDENANKLYVAIREENFDGSQDILLYELAITANGIGEGRFVKQWSSGADGIAKIVEMHVAPDGGELALGITHQDLWPFDFSGGFNGGLSLNAISFNQNNQAVAVGNGGTIQLSEDLGQTWQTVSSGTSNSMQAVSFFGTDGAVAVGRDATILRSKDKGQTWESVAAPVQDNLVAVDFVDHKRGFAVGEQGSLLKTTNAGKSWQEVDHQLNGAFTQLGFWDVDNGLALVDGVVWQTLNGGKDWSLIGNGIVEPLIDVEVLDGGVAYVLSMGGYVYRSSGQEGVWQQTNGPPLTGAKDMAWLDASRGMVSGADGLLAVTQDGGQSWTAQNTNSQADFQSVALSGGGQVLAASNTGATVGGSPAAQAASSVSVVGLRSHLKRIDMASNQKEIVDDYLDELHETELRRGANDKMYVNQRTPSATLPAGGNTGQTGSSTGGNGTSNAAKKGPPGGATPYYPSGNHKHTIKLFDLDGLGQATYREEKVLQTEVVSNPANGLQKDFLTFDYTPESRYIFYVEKKTTSGGQNAYFGGNTSRLLVYSNPEAPAVANVTPSILALNSGPANFGLPLQPHRVFEDVCAPGPKVGLYSYRTVGKRLYETTDHLGNVRVTYGSKRIAGSLQAHLVQDWSLDVRIWQDYYGFGMLMPGRGVSVGGYRYGFNGKEFDSEVKGGVGLHYDYGARVYDPRLGKFLSVDPLGPSYPWYTPYQFAGNSPVMAIDLDGLEIKMVTRYFDDEKRYLGTEVMLINEKGRNSFVLGYNTATVIWVDYILYENGRKEASGSIIYHQDYDPDGFKPHSLYDYTSEESMYQKFLDDIDYIENGKEGNPVERYWELLKRDLTAPDNIETVDNALFVISVVFVTSVQLSQIKPMGFPSDEALETHWTKHGGEFGRAYKNKYEYLQGARDVINRGTRVKYMYKGKIRTGFIKFMRNDKKGNAVFEFVGMNPKGEIATYHTKSGKNLFKLLNGNKNNNTIKNQ